MTQLACGVIHSVVLRNNVARPEAFVFKLQPSNRTIIVPGHESVEKCTRPLLRSSVSNYRNWRSAW